MAHMIFTMYQKVYTQDYETRNPKAIIMTPILEIPIVTPKFNQ
ncbi:hypothetical protein bpmyx0001_20960 [Bacillus pseudomycoides DSM 12442]|nr:hypothetical protein bpmyx0001_20960 [Bacillus pseudomycoides DSM 12442]